MDVDARAASAPADPEPHVPGVEPDYLRADKGVRSWLLTLDHKRIGIMFLVATTVMLLLGGTFAMLLRTELLTPGRTYVDALTYNRFFTMHGIVMVFLFMIPAIPSGFGNFLLPIMLGAKDVAFPRLNLLSLYLYLAGAGLVLWGLISGGTDTGWTFYTPYSTQGSPTAVAPVALGIFVVGFSSILTGLNFVVTVHTMRAEGMHWLRMPLFVWSIYATSIIQVLATPVLGLSLLLVAMDHVFGMGIFDPRMGGDPVLFQHLFWFYSHPAVYIMILPAFAVITEVVCTYCKKAPPSYRMLMYSSLGIAFIGFLAWGHHMFVSGMSGFDVGVFGILSMFVSVFSAIKVFTWVGTMYRGKVTLSTPLLYFLGFLFLFVFGGMTGVAVAAPSLDVHWHDTYFVVAHFHFIMVGGQIMAFLAALHYWFPKLFGRLYNERVGLFGAAVVFMGFNLTFIPQFILGNAGMPRRYYTYPDRYHALNVLSTGGAYLLGAGLVFVLGYLLVALKWGPRATPNPWGSMGFEWLTSSPPIKHNFPEPLKFKRGPYDYHEPEA